VITRKVENTTEACSFDAWCFKTWRDHAYPSCAHFDSFWDSYSTRLGTVETKEDNVFIHCSAGVGRTGTLLVIQSLRNNVSLRDIYTHATITAKIEDLRQYRAALVSNVGQVNYIDRIVNMYCEDDTKTSYITHGTNRYPDEVLLRQRLRDYLFDSYDRAMDALVYSPDNRFTFYIDNVSYPYSMNCLYKTDGNIYQGEPVYSNTEVGQPTNFLTGETAEVIQVRAVYATLQQESKKQLNNMLNTATANHRTKCFPNMSVGEDKILVYRYRFIGTLKPAKDYFEKLLDTFTHKHFMYVFSDILLVPTDLSAIGK
jgi:hypothetical protein